jgi:polysaccharide biosynthesis transport protein
MSASDRFTNSFETQSQSSGIPLLEVIWRRKLLILLFVVLGLGCGYWYYMEAPRVYQSTAVVLVKERQAAPLTTTNIELAQSDKMETQLQVIASRAVLSRAAEILANPTPDDGEESATQVESENVSGSQPSTNETTTAPAKEVQPIATADGKPAAEDVTLLAPQESKSTLTASPKKPHQPERLASGLQASIVRNSETISVSYRSSDPEAVTRTLEAILKAYDEQLRSTYQDIGEETAKLIKKASENLDKDINKKRADYMTFRDVNKDQLLMIDGQLANTHSKRLGELLLQYGQLESKSLTLKTELKQIEEIAKTMPVDQAAALSVLAKLNELTGGALLHQKDNATAGIERSTLEIQRLTDLLLQEKELSARFGEEHPKIQDSRDKIKLLSELIDKLEEEKKRAAEQIAGQAQEKENALQLPKSPEEWVSTYAGILSQDLKRVEAEMSVVTEAIKSVRKLAQDLDRIIVQDNNHREEIKQAESLNTQILTRLDEIDIVKQSGGTRAVILNPPTFARQVAPSLIQVLAISGVLGCLLGIAIGYLLEQGKGTFRSPMDITRNLELPILGQVPAIEARRVKRSTQLATVPQTIITAHQPSSSISESFRAIRTSLYFSGEGKDSQVIQVTSPTPGDGKSTLISNLAVSIAKSGKKVLLIDADLRRPTLHRIFGVDNNVGLVSHLANESDGTIEPIATLIPGLSILPSGPSVSNPSELLSSAKMAELVTSLREIYDFVLIDTPPILAVTDPLTVAARVDGVILAIRIANGIQFSSKRAKEALDRVGANILGVVVNGFAANSAFARGVAKDYGYSGSYGYGYRSGYGYSRNPYSEPYSERSDSSRAIPASTSK